MHVHFSHACAVGEYSRSGIHWHFFMWQSNPWPTQSLLASHFFPIDGSGTDTVKYTMPRIMLTTVEKDVSIHYTNTYTYTHIHEHT